MYRYQKNIIMSIILQFIKMVLGFCTSIIVARGLGPENSGYVSFFLTIITMIASYGHFGIDSSSAYFLKQPMYKKEEIVNTNISFVLTISVVIITGMLFLNLKGILLPEYQYYLILLGGIYILTMFLVQCLRGLYIGEERIKGINLSNLVSEVIFFIVLMTLFLFNKLDSRIYILIFTLSAIPNMLLMLFNYKGWKKFKFKMNKNLLQNEIKYGLIVHLGAFFIFLNFRIDQFFIKNYLSIKLLGIYTIAVSLAELVFILPNSIKPVLTGRLYNCDSKYKKKYLLNTLKLTTYLCIIITGVGTLMAPLITVLYGEAYTQSIEIFRLLLIGVIFASFGKLASIIVIVEGKIYTYFIFNLITCVSNIFLNVFLIPYLGLAGAAIASNFSYLIYALLFNFYLLKEKKYKLSEIFLFKIRNLRQLSFRTYED